MRRTDNGVEIVRIQNGYILRYPTEDGEEWDRSVIEDDVEDKLKSTEELLWHILEVFGMEGSRHDKERLCIKREPGDKYENV